MDKPMNTDTLPTRASLLQRVRDLDDSESWNTFFEVYSRRVQAIARTRGLTDVEAQDVAQEVFKCIAQKIDAIRPSSRRGQFRRWLRQLTSWRAADHLRQRRRFMHYQRTVGTSARDRAAEGTSTIERVPAPPELEAVFETESRRHLIQALFHRVRQVIPAKQLQVFQTLMMDERTPAEVAKIYNINLATVYVIRHRVGGKLRDEIAKLGAQLEDVSLPRSEID